MIGALGVLLAGCPTGPLPPNLYIGKSCTPTGVLPCPAPLTCLPVDGGFACQVGPSGSSGSGSTSTGGSGSSSGGGIGSGGSSGGSSSAASSSSTGGANGGSTSGGVTSVTSAAGSTGCAGGGTPLPSRVLATVDSFEGQIWDLTNPAMGLDLIGSANLLSDIPTAIAETDTPGDQEILVLLDTEGLVAFDTSGNFIGQIEVPVPGGEFQGGGGLAYIPQGCGATPVVVVCGDQVTAFRYPGLSAFTANGKAYPTAIYSDNASGNGATVDGGILVTSCAPGPANSFFAVGGPNLGWYDALTDHPHGGTGLFAQSQGIINGVALDPSDDVLIVGDDGDVNGFAALFTPSGICKEARSGGACTLTCNAGCVAGDPDLANTPLNAAAFSNGVFLATASTENPNAMNTVLQLDPSNALAVSNYYVGPSNTDFLGIFAAPQPP